MLRKLLWMQQVEGLKSHVMGLEYEVA